MIVNLGINRVHRTKSLLIGFLAIFLSHTGFAQDIIFDSGSLTKENNLTSEHPYYSPKAQPLTTDMPSVVSDTANQPESPLFDLTATISEDEIEVATPESLPVINNENEQQTPSILTQGGRGELSSNSSDLRDEKNVSTKDNNSELEKQMADPEFFKSTSKENKEYVKEHENLVKTIPTSYAKWETMQKDVLEMESQLED